MKREFSLKLARKNNLLIIFFIAAIFFSSCQRNKIDEDTLVRIYVENIIVEESQSPNSKESVKKKEEIVKRYNVSQKDVDDAMLSMKGDKERWDSFFQKANALVDDLKKSGTIK